jgi:hypothetical protein
VAAYGSYYRAGFSAQEGLTFDAVLDTAKALGAPTIRVWAGKGGSAEADDAHWRKVVTDLRQIGTAAQDAGIVVACEYHANTLTDTNACALRLMDEVAHPNVLLYWQPPVGKAPDDCAAGLRAVLPFLVNLHVFHWVMIDGSRDQRPLEEGADVWRRYFDIAASTGREHWAMLEFVREGTPGQFLADAKVLSAWAEEQS